MDNIQRLIVHHEKERIARSVSVNEVHAVLCVSRVLFLSALFIVMVRLREEEGGGGFFSDRIERGEGRREVREPKTKCTVSALIGCRILRGSSLSA